MISPDLTNRLSTIVDGMAVWGANMTRTRPPGIETVRRHVGRGEAAPLIS